MKVGFWKALTGSCSGTAVFSALREQHLGRAVWHLLLMLVLCSAIVTWGLNSKLRPVVMRAVDVFAEHCGGLQIDESCMTPLKSPEKARSFLLPGPWAIIYLPVISSTPDPLMTKEALMQGANQGVIWSPRHLVLWNKVATGYEASALSRTQQGFGKKLHFSTVTELLAGVPQTQADGFGVKLDAPIIMTAETLRTEAKIVLPIGIALVTFQQTLSEVVIYLLMFAAVFTLMNMGKPRRVRFAELLVLEIYAGFPAMLIGSAATALDLPFLEFNFIYVLGMTLYLIWILNRLNERDERRDSNTPYSAK